MKLRKNLRRFYIVALLTLAGPILYSLIIAKQYQFVGHFLYVLCRRFHLLKIRTIVFIFSRMSKQKGTYGVMAAYPFSISIFQSNMKKP